MYVKYLLTLKEKKNERVFNLSFSFANDTTFAIILIINSFISYSLVPPKSFFNFLNSVSITFFIVHISNFSFYNISEIQKVLLLKFLFNYQ